MFLTCSLFLLFLLIFCLLLLASFFSSSTPFLFLCCFSSLFFSHFFSFGLPPLPSYFHHSVCPPSSSFSLPLPLTFVALPLLSSLPSHPFFSTLFSFHFSFPLLTLPCLASPSSLLSLSLLSSSLLPSCHSYRLSANYGDVSLNQKGRGFAKKNIGRHIEEKLEQYVQKSRFIKGYVLAWKLLGLCELKCTALLHLIDSLFYFCILFLLWCNGGL